MNWQTMKRCAAALLGLAAALAAFAVRAADQVGFVDVDRVFAESRAGKQSKADLDNEAAGYSRELQQLNESAASAQQDLDKNGLTLSEGDRAQRLRRIGEIRAQFDRRKQEFSEEYGQHRDDAVAALLKQVEKSVAKVAEQAHLDVVVNRAVAVAAPADITNKVIADLDRATPDPAAAK